MADLNDLLKRASSKTTMPIVKAPKRDFGLKKTMESIKNESAELNVEKNNGNENEKLILKSTTVAVDEIIRSDFVIPKMSLNDQIGTLVENSLSEYKAMADFENSQSFVQQQPESAVTGDKLETNQRQSADKLETIERQTEDKLETMFENQPPLEHRVIEKPKPETNQRQTRDSVSKLETNQRQTRDTKVELETASYKTRDKVPPEVETRLETNRGQTGYKVQTTNQFSSLVGLQRTLVVEIYKSCKSTRSTLSEPLSIEYLTELTQSTVSSIKKTIQRLEQKEIITRVEFKNGRGGWTIYTINDSIYQNILRIEAEDRLETKWRQSRDKVESELRTELETSPPSKLVSNINNNLLTKPPIKEVEHQLDVSAIVTQSLAKYGITRKHIQDIFNQKLEFTTATLQDFLDRFAIYASDPKNIKNINSIPAVFVKMAQLASKGQDPLVDIETDADRLIRERIESLKTIQEARLKQENELMALEFENWYTCLTVDQMNQSAPPTPASKSGSSTQKLILKNYFIENIWPYKRGDVCAVNGLVSNTISNLIEM